MPVTSLINYSRNEMPSSTNALSITRLSYSSRKDEGQTNSSSYFSNLHLRMSETSRETHEVEGAQTSYYNLTTSVVGIYLATFHRAPALLVVATKLMPPSTREDE